MASSPPMPRAAFDRALTLDAQDVMARFYMGMAADQDGRRAEAEKIWRDLLAEAPPGAPWIEVVRHALARNAPAGTEAAASACPRRRGPPRRPPIMTSTPWWSGSPTG